MRHPNLHLENLSQPGPEPLSSPFRLPCRLPTLLVLALTEEGISRSQQRSSIVVVVDAISPGWTAVVRLELVVWASSWVKGVSVLAH